MSRYTATVRKPCDDDQTERIDCDGVHVDQGGDLHIQLRRNGDVQTVARFQHGHWASYELEPTTESDADESDSALVDAIRVTASRVKGRYTLAELRAHWGLSPVEPDVDVPVKAEVPPEVDSIVHLITFSGRDCKSAKVLCSSSDGALVVHPVGDSTPWPREVKHDEARTESHSWHYPCTGDGQDAEPEPDVPINVTINVSHAGMSPTELHDAINKQLRAAWGGYGTLRR